MKKITKVLAVLLASFGLCASVSAAQQDVTPTAEEATTRGDAVIFKVHDITPISKEGVVTGCDFTVTLYNRTAINFRNFTLNLKWNDSVEESFAFDTYIKGLLGDKITTEEAKLLENASKQEPLTTALTVNAFGANKQLSLKSHIDNEKCYLLLKKAAFSVDPCDIARNTTSKDNKTFASSGKECTALFQFVDTANPEYFGEFNNISATDIAMQNKQMQAQELTEIDIVISKIIENLGISDKTLTDIN